MLLIAADNVRVEAEAQVPLASFPGPGLPRVYHTQPGGHGVGGQLAPALALVYLTWRAIDEPGGQGGGGQQGLGLPRLVFNTLPAVNFYDSLVKSHSN